MAQAPRWKVALILALLAFLLHGSLFLLAQHAAYAHGASEETFLAAEGDAHGYMELGQTLARTGAFETASGTPEFNRTPGYPALVALVLNLTGSLTATIFVQLVLLAATVTLIFLIGDTLLSRMAGISAALLYAIDPTSIIQAFGIYTETTFVFLFLLAAYLLFCTERRITWLAAGIVGGVAIWVRPVGIYLIPLLFLAAAITWQRDWSMTLKRIAVGLMTAFVVICPWMARNYALGGSFSVSSILAFNPLFYNIVMYESSSRGVSEQVVTEEIMNELGATNRDEVKTFAYAGAERALTKHYLLAHPGYFIYHAIKTIPFFVGSSVETAEALLHQNGVLLRASNPDTDVTALFMQGKLSEVARALTSNIPSLVERILWLIVWVSAGIYALWVIVRTKPEWRLAVAFLGIALIIAGITGPVFSPRYRLPAEPFVFLLAFEALRLLWSRFSKI